MTERTPPGRVSLARVTIKCTARRSNSRIVDAGYQGYRSAQDCPVGVCHAMISEFAPHNDALRETVARYDAGEERPVGLDAAKRELRKRAE